MGRHLIPEAALKGTSPPGESKLRPILDSHPEARLDGLFEPGPRGSARRNQPNRHRYIAHSPPTDRRPRSNHQRKIQGKPNNFIPKSSPPRSWFVHAPAHIQAWPCHPRNSRFGSEWFSDCAIDQDVAATLNGPLSIPRESIHNPVVSFHFSSSVRINDH